MNEIRIALALVLALLIPACGGSKSSTTVINNTNINPSPFTILGSSSGGATGSNESGGVADLGTDGQPRSVYVFTGQAGGGPLQVRFSRRNADGSWTAALPISANDTDLKDFVVSYVTPNNNFTHIFWLEGVSAAAYQLHYAQINNADPPAIVLPDTVLSQGPSTGVGLGAAYNRVDLYKTVFDAGSNNIYVMWIQRIMDGGTETAVPMVGAIIAGAGLFQERFALLSPTGAGTDHAAMTCVLRVASSGRVHALWGNTNSVFHRLRTGSAIWSSGPAGDQVSGFGPSIPARIELLLAADGDAYAAWLDSTELRAAYRPVGDGSVFAADVFVNNASSANKLAAVLEPGTEHLHLFVGAIMANPANVITYRNPAANLGGAWETETVDSVGSITSQVVDYAVWADSTNRVVVAYQLPPAPGELSNIRARIRPSGPGNGNYAPAVNLTANGPLPCEGLTVARDASGNAILAWSQGNPHIVPLAEIFGALYTSGGTFGASFNVSQTPGVGSHGPIFAVLKSGGTAYFSWMEAIATGPDSHDVYFALKP